LLTRVDHLTATLQGKAATMGEETTACAVCERPVGAAGIAADGHAFCCEGCRNVHEELPPPEDEVESEPADDEQRTNSDLDGDAGEETTTFLHVDGMHCATCETFLTSIATKQPGVTTAEASYVTETLRVTHDPATVAAEGLADAVSVVGYTATPKDELATVAQERERRDDRRHLDDMLGFRYAAGVLVAVFMMLPYVVVIYPAQVAELLDRPVALFASGPGPGQGLLIWPLFLTMTCLVLLFTGLPLLRGAYVSLRVREPNTDLLVTSAVLAAFAYGTVAFAVGNIHVYYDLTILIAATVVAAVFYESLAKRNAVDRLTDLTVSQVETARLARGETTPVEDLSPGDTVIVARGERIPVDGTLENESCTVDEAVVTGESLPVRKAAGDEVLGGAVVTDGRAVVAVGDPPTSSIDRLTADVWDLQSATHGLQRRSDRLAARLLPALAAVALLAGAVTFVRASPIEGVFAALGAVIVLCPWVLGLSTPLSVATSIEAATEEGIIVFDETVFDRLRETDIVVFDKTGTLTTGEMRLVETDIPDSLLGAVAALERHASHPAAQAITDAVETRADGSVETKADGGVEQADGVSSSPAGERVADVTNYATGIGGIVDGEELLVGSLDLFADRGWAVSEEVETRAVEARGVGRLPVVVGREGHAEGVIVVGDDPRSGWEETITRFGERDVETVVLTGDDEAAADLFAYHAGVDHVFAGVPPTGKTEVIRRLQADGHVTMVGDGTNDGPALAAADLGVAIGSGTALASEAADIAIVEDDLSAVDTAFELATVARRRLQQNTALALLYNLVTVPVALASLLNPLFVIGAAVLSSGLVGLNAFRPLLD
jgi:heavy metal translocating P-type ATPase